MGKLNMQRSNVRRSIDIMNSVIDDVAFDAAGTPFYFEYISYAASLRTEIEKWRTYAAKVINNICGG